MYKSSGCNFNILLTLPQPICNGSVDSVLSTAKMAIQLRSYDNNEVKKPTLRKHQQLLLKIVVHRFSQVGIHFVSLMLHETAFFFFSQDYNWSSF